MIGPAGTASPTPSSGGIAAVEAGHQVRYFTAAELVETLYRGLADNSVSHSSTPCCATTPCSSTSLGLHRWTTPEPRLLFRFVVAAYERRSLGIASHWPFESLGPVPARATTAVTMLDRLLPLPHRRHSRRLLPHETGQSEGRNPSRWAVAVRQSARRKHRGPRGCAHGRRGGHHGRGRCLRGCVRLRSRGGHVGDRCRPCRGELEGERHPAQGTADPSDGLQVRLGEGGARSNCTGTHDEQLRGRIVQNTARAGVAPHRGFTHPQFWSAATSPNGVTLNAGGRPQSTRPRPRAEHRRTAGCLSPKRTAAGQARARRVTESHPMAISHPRPAEVRTMQTIHAAEAIPQSLLGRHGDIAPTCWCGQDLEYVGRIHCPRCGRAAYRRSVPPAEPAHSS